MRRTSRLSLFALLALTLCVLLWRSSPAETGQAAESYAAYLPLIFKPPPAPVWLGPDGGPVTSVAAHGNTVYAGVWGSGVFKSTDGGATWVWKGNGIADLLVYSIAIDPFNPQIA